MWGGKKQLDVRGRKIDVLVMVNPLINMKEAAEMVKIYCRRYMFDLLVGFWDCFALEFMRDVGLPYLVYFPVDGCMTGKWYAYVKDAFRLVAYSRFGYEEVLKFAPASRVSYVPHGIDCETFRPLNVDKAELRRGIEAAPPIPEDCFLFLFVGANMGDRKKIPLLLRTFKRFTEKHPDAHIYLHTNAYARYGRGYDLPIWIDMLGIKDRVHYPRFNPIIESLTDEQMSRIYGAADVYISNSVAEGFGLPLIEAQACGLPIIVGRNSASVELAEGHGWIADNVDEEAYVDVPVYVPQLTHYPVIDQRSLFEKMEEAYENEDLREKYGREARRFAEGYSWGKVIKKWFKLLDEVEGGLRLFKKIREGLR